MKRKGIYLALVTMLILGIVGSTALAQESSFSGGLSLLLPGDGTIMYLDGGYERVLNSGLALHGEAGLGLQSGVTIIRGLLGVKKYLNPTAPEGLWVGGFGSLDYWSDTIPGGSWSGTFSGFGAEGGYKHFFTPQLSVEPFARVGFYTGGMGLALILGAGVGYAF